MGEPTSLTNSGVVAVDSGDSGWAAWVMTDGGAVVELEVVVTSDFVITAACTAGAKEVLQQANKRATPTTRKFRRILEG